MSNAVAITEAPRRSILAAMASRFDMEPAAFEATLRGTVMKKDKDGNEATREEFAAFLVVANEYNLNPLTKEIYAFFDRQRGGIIPIVGVDGWARIINEHKAFDGMSFRDERDAAGKVVAITCCMHRKDRTHPIEATEYLAECRRDTGPWKTWPYRMLRHKAMIQAARYAFGFSGIYDEDEAERITASRARDVTPASPGISGVQQRLLERNASAPIDMQAHVENELAPVNHDPETGEIHQSRSGPLPAATEGSPAASSPDATPAGEPTLSWRERGRAAYHADMDRTDCPAEATKAQKAEWLAGYEEAAGEDDFPGGPRK